ncbi:MULTISPECIES: LLM class F420-dependent oxidoreductase [Agromyces]|uniref:LLM class F420-dependent oxidoreductase n=1 Tax=Agromyces mediolanus TaxID=41986 RepID=A0A918CBJ3_AGRME|nr:MULTISPECIES: LLM class F420-dependent oxidoreductase [Agromyces]GGR16230.1 LLM class F420-dependent oxidoreductase [Agromyces mediolanus]GLJ73607.1 LLM class F420-dependent oxidoreductase [Agromyces mediolanus]GLU89242.1 LLM class F420-dependent oxidoreductase [Agromyces sp. NBRC 114283]
MRVGMFLNYAGGFAEVADEVGELEAAGVDLVAVPEAYSFDAVSQLGFLAARTSTITLASGILQLYTRTPTLTAMTAAGLDYVSGGRFELGIGASGPQVIEGFHGVRYDAPVGRTREIIEICRATWRREPVVHEGRHYRIPLPAGEGTGLGKPLKLINHPVRERIPITVAALGPKSVEQTAEIADGWLPMFFHPERAGAVWGDALAAGTARRPAGLAPLDVFASPALAITERPEDVLPLVKPQLALYVGGMGARGKNFYNDLVASYGFAEEAARIQELYLAGRKEEAVAAVPDELVRAISLIGPASYVAERVAAFAEAGVTTLTVTPLARSSAERVALMAGFRRLVG